MVEADKVGFEAGNGLALTGERSRGDCEPPLLEYSREWPEELSSLSRGEVERDGS